MDLTQIFLETDRLILVPKSPEYGESIFVEYREPVTLYLHHPAPESLALLLERIEDQEVAMKAGRALHLAVLLKESQEFLGCFSLEDLGSTHPEMGGWLKESAHGRRFGQEAARAVKEWADGHLEYHHLVWPCAAENIASRKLAVTLGGKVEREYRKRTSGGLELKYADYWIPRNQHRRHNG